MRRRSSLGGLRGLRGLDRLGLGQPVLQRRDLATHGGELAGLDERACATASCCWTRFRRVWARLLRWSRMPAVSVCWRTSSAPRRVAWAATGAGPSAPG